MTPVPRSPEDILASADAAASPTSAPVAKDKWLMASVENDAAAVVAQVFDEGQRRDPGHQRPWVALVDGNNHQIARIKAEAKARKVRVPIVVDFIHVLEYLWSAAWCFFAEGDAGAEAWVADKAMAVLHGQASTVAASWSASSPPSLPCCAPCPCCTRTRPPTGSAPSTAGCTWSPPGFTPSSTPR